MEEYETANDALEAAPADETDELGDGARRGKPLQGIDVEPEE